jgi:hypothetical protein
MAFEDALKLGNRDSRTLVSLALCQAGLGNAASARGLLAAHMQEIPAPDYGLAMAMAGDPREAVRALLSAVEAPGATAQTRQNLAYALALSGNWTQARRVAGEDLSAEQAENRIGQWAHQVAEGNERSRIFAMIGVAPRADDEGLPAALALQSAPAAPETPVALAKADDVAPAPVPLEFAKAVPAPAPAVSAVQTIAIAASASPAVPIMAATESKAPPVMPAHDRAPAKAPPVSLARLMADLPKPAASPAKPATALAPARTVVAFEGPVSDARASDWVVQLGAFDTDAIAKEKWRLIVKRHAGLDQYQTVSSQYEGAQRSFARLAIRGFADRTAANSLCATLQTAGQPCFVRLDDTKATSLARAEARKRSGELASGPKAGAGKDVSLAIR